VRTDQEEVRAARVLIATGTGAGPVCAGLGTHLAVLPQVLTWFPIADVDRYRSQQHQVFIRSSRDAQFYGFPSTDGWTAKVAASIYLDEVASMARPLTWDPRHLDTVRSWVRTFLPDLVPEPVKMVVCADGYTADETGLLGHIPGMDGVVVAVGFSGHGFKMATSLGAVAADLIVEGTSTTDVSFMDPMRFSEPQRTVAALPLAGTGS
jgi:sarcosine oxidase